MKVVLLPKAEQDLLDGIDWFQRISPSLGTKFENEFYACIDRIVDNPKLFSANEFGFRAVRLKRYTAVTYYRLDGDSIVIVRLLVNGREDESLVVKS